MPRLAGMRPQYVAQQIGSFVAGTRPHPQPADLAGLSADDAQDLSQFLAQVR